MKLENCGKFLAIFLLGCVCVVAGCSTSAAKPNSQATTLLKFIDLSSFDRDLNASLASPSETVTVDFYESMSPNKIPDRLQRWISDVEKSGGKIDVQPPDGESRTRNLAFVIGLISSAWSGLKTLGELKAENMLKVAGSRDVVVNLKRNTSGELAVDQIRFVRRSKTN